jgi:hypothetical protein
LLLVLPSHFYRETVFVDPTYCSVLVMAAPGDRVHVATTDPNSGQVDDRKNMADSAQAWTSHLKNALTGTTSAADSTVVTEGPSLTTASYPTPGSSMTYGSTADGRNCPHVHRVLGAGR